MRIYQSIRVLPLAVAVFITTQIYDTGIIFKNGCHVII
jgi:hypothetical protein